jgi:hypothetical protein
VLELGLEKKENITVMRSYLVAGAVSLGGTVINGVVALGQTIVVFSAANHFD